MRAGNIGASRRRVRPRIARAPGWLAALLLDPPAAHAHRPHAVVGAVDAAADAPWLALTARGATDLLASDDGGRHWGHLAAPPEAEDLAALATLAGDRVAVSVGGTLWREATGWAPEATGASEVRGGVRAGDTLWLATDVGLVAVEPDGLRVEAAGDLVAVGAGPGGVAVLARDGTLAWNGSPVPPHPLGLPLSLAVATDALVAGTALGVSRLEAGAPAWSACGALPVTSAEPHAEEVVRLVALEDGTLLAATGQQAVFVSTDGCRSWILDDCGAVIPYEGSGSLSDPLDAYTGLHLQGDAGLVAGFDGVQWREGSGWLAAVLLPEDFCRGVAFAPGYPGDPTLYAACYGGGLHVSRDDGRTWTVRPAGLAGEAVYGQSLRLDPEGRIYWVGNHQPWRSVDGGTTFEPLAVPLAEVVAFDLAGDRLWALGTDASHRGAAAWSADAGEPWTLDEALGEALAGAAPRWVREGELPDGPVLLVATGEPGGLLVSRDGGASWNWWLQGRDGPGAGVALWPPEAPRRLVVADAVAGARWTEDGGATWQEADPPPGPDPRRLVMADDGTLLLADRLGVLWASEDGGASWRALGEPLPATVYDLAVAPGFAASGRYVAATRSGMHAGSLARGGLPATGPAPLPRHQRLAAGSVHLACEDGCVEAVGPDGLVTLELEPGATVRASFEASAWSVAAVGAWRAIPDPGPLDPGWHDVTLEALGPVSMEAIEAWTDGAPPWAEAGGTDSTAPADTAPPGGGAQETDTGTAGGLGPPAPPGGCGGCGAPSPSAPGWLLLAAAAYARRSRRDRQSR